MEPTDFPDDPPQPRIVVSSFAPRTDEHMHQGLAEVRVGVRTIKLMLQLVLVLLFVVAALVFTLVVGARS